MPSQLLVKFPSSKEWPGWHFQQYLLTNIDLKPPSTPTPATSSASTTTGAASTSNASTSHSATASSPNTQAQAQPKLLTITIEPKTHADYLGDASVFTGYTHDPTTGAITNTYALKFAFRQDLIASLASEGTVYMNYLSSVQDSVVPRCEGLFLGSPLPGIPPARGDSAASASGRKGERYVEEDIEEEDKGMAACLVLEWWGKSVSRPFHRLPLQTRFLIIDHLATFHRLGLYHGDFAERNVLIKPRPKTSSSAASRPPNPSRPTPHTLPALSYSSSSSSSTSSTNSVRTPASERPSENAYFTSQHSEDEDIKHTSSPVSSSLKVTPTQDVTGASVATGQSAEEEEEFDVRLIDFDLVMKHDCRGCDRDFRVPFTLSSEETQALLTKTQRSGEDALPDGINRLHIEDEDDEEDEEEMSPEARAFGCDQLYDVCKYTMRVWD